MIYPRVWTFTLAAACLGALLRTCPAQTACHPDVTAVTEGDDALYKGDWSGAAALFGQTLARNPNDDEARAEWVRALLEEGKVADAEAMASKFLAERPNTAAAETAMARVFYREGDIPDAYKHVHAAVTLDPCNGRAHHLLGKIYALNLMEASAEREYKTAHALKPTDNDIHLVWMYWLPPAERVAPLTDYIEHNPYYDKKDMNPVVMLDDTKAAAMAKPVGCQAIFTPPETKLPLEPIFNDPFIRQPNGRVAINVERLETNGPQDINFPIQGWGLDISLNGKRRRLELSTAFNDVVLTRSAAAALNLKIEEHMHLSGTNSFTTHLDDIKFGNLEFHNCSAVVFEDRDLPNGRDGMIGMNVLRDYLITMDVPDRELRLAQLPPRPGESSNNAVSLQTVEGTSASSGAVRHDRYIPPEMKSWTPMYRTWSVWLVSAHVDKGRERLFLLDTSKTFSYFDIDFAKSQTKIDEMVNIFHTDENGVRRRMQKADFITLYDAGIQQPMRDVYVTKFSRVSNQYGFEVDGALGMQSFPNRVLKLDYRDGLILVAPLGTR